MPRSANVCPRNRVRYMATSKNSLDRLSLEQWIASRDWYQTIELSNGLVTPGRTATNRRLSYLRQIDFGDKRVLDVGCNSGQYALFAKQRGAREVVGVDLDEGRLEQARVLADSEGLDVTFERCDLLDVPKLGQFDVVLCIAVVTEVPDLFGALDALKRVIGSFAFLELDLARPLAYLSLPRVRKPLAGRIPRRRALAEVRQTKQGRLVLSPTFEVLAGAFGDDFVLKDRGQGVKYQMVDVFRRQGQHG